MNRDKTRLWSYSPETIVVTAENAADWITAISAVQQAALFACMTEKVDEWGAGDWPMQCRRIAEELTDEECAAVRSMLDPLMDHLAAIPVERKAERLAAEIVGAVDSLTGREVTT